MPHPGNPFQEESWKITVLTSFYSSLSGTSVFCCLISSTLMKMDLIYLVYFFFFFTFGDGRVSPLFHFEKKQMSLPFNIYLHTTCTYFNDVLPISWIVYPKLQHWKEAMRFQIQAIWLTSKFSMFRFSKKVEVTQSCLTLCEPMDYRVHGILQARILEWVAVPFSRGSYQLNDWTQSLENFVFQDHIINFRNFIKIKIVDKYHGVLSSR